ncbi:hypothetical protein JCGZ_17023 [Jatropha curcas]|uniref:Exostosin GT47 domain-containing protein n=1 Tax=Jatropha curcas TaxID=180498 RepID=A0A067K223_JATCU|nr:hypothetical protein JCGZ_17023 [Jatropha curcas]
MAKKSSHIHLRLLYTLLVYFFILLVYYFCFLNQNKIGVGDFLSSLYSFPSSTTANNSYDDIINNTAIKTEHEELEFSSTPASNTSVGVSSFVTVLALSSSQNPPSSLQDSDNYTNGVSPVSAVTEPTEQQKKKKEKKKGSLERVENGLAKVRASIREAIKTQNYSSYKEETYIPRGILYRNPYAFHQSHIEMEKRLKIWVYKEGEQPLVHDGPVNDIYGIEGQFIDEMESGKSHYMARHPDEAQLFFLPISVAKIIHFVYRPLVTYSRAELQRLVEDYIGVIAHKYPYWNRSNGADHFLVSCHDWAPQISLANPNLFKNFIRVLCNANTSERFEPQRDVSIPETKIPVGKLDPTAYQGIPPSKRRLLAFFAGGAHGYIRKVLLKHWKEKDNENKTNHYFLQSPSSPSPIPLPVPYNSTSRAFAVSSVSLVNNKLPKKKKKKKKRSLGRIENELARARAAIHEAVSLQNYSSFKVETFVPRGVMYRNPYAFHQNHIEMEKRLKIWVYKEGESPLVHDGPVNSINGIEGHFINEMERGKSHFIARHPDEAHLFFLPISVANVVQFVYRPITTYSRVQLTTDFC